MKKTNFSCSQCSKTWQKQGGTNCWSNDPEAVPPKPGNCPSKDHLEVIQESFELYKGDSVEAKMARVAAKVEGLCYQPVPGSEAVNARWTRVEDTIAFAKLLNRAETDMNVIVGLCVGHDMLFSKYSEAPVTTMVVKDRVTGHNPVSVLYGQNFYHKRLQVQPLEVEE
jgi:uncharacterized metal-binding protein